jgi:predicted MFS family arabinose efflux permease
VSRERWAVLALLVGVRTSMGFQFQSVGAVSPLMITDLNVGYTELGTLIGAYLLPGVAVALPGGWLAGRFGDRRIVLAGLALMTLGGVVTGVAGSFGLALAGRLVAGSGAVLLNVVLAKMVTDWFAEGQLVTAMGFLLGAWPLGIALALVCLGSVAEATSWQLVMHLAAFACVAALLLMRLFYPSAPTAAATTGPVSQSGLEPAELWPVIAAGVLWATYNAAFVIVLGFAPEYFAGHGYPVAMAGMLTSLVGWTIIPSLPLGGYLVERLAMPAATMAVCFVVLAAAIMALPVATAPALLLVLIGVVFGPPGGLIMALPAQALAPARRALGMGVYYTCYYAGMAALPSLAGLSRDLTRLPAAPFAVAAVLMLASLLALGAFHFLRRKLTPIPDSTTRCGFEPR